MLEFWLEKPALIAYFLSYLVFSVYRYFLVPMALVILKLFHRFFPLKIRQMIEARVDARWPELPSRPIWIHASSGEIEYAKPLIRALKQKWPQRMILVTYYSPSAKELFKSTQGIDAAVPLPWDGRGLVRKFLDHFKPEILLIARSDVWPEFVYQCRKRKIPCLLFSATLSTQNRQAFFGSPISHFAFNQLDRINCVSEEDAAEIGPLRPHVSCQVGGDTRYDQVFWRLQNPHELKSISHIKRGPELPTFVIGSSWPEDEKILIPALPEFIKKGGRVIMAPHEISDSRLKAIEKSFGKLEIPSVRYSQCEHWEPTQVLLVDQIGYLPELYTWGDLAFVGGSFKAKVHSVMEPLAAGLPTLVGPFHQNNREALHFQNSFIKINFPMVSVIKEIEDLQYHLDFLLKEKSHWQPYRTLIQQKMRQKCGATVSLMEQIEALSP